jgi:sugar lactone lactonase YvrE
MIQSIQKRPQWQRVIIFSVVILAIIVIIYLITLGVAYMGVNTGPRTQSIAMQDSMTVREWAVLPGDDAYPGSLTIDTGGNVYTGSYVNGTIWHVTPDGDVSEMPESGETFGSIAGLVWADNTLYVLDRNSPLTIAGMSLWQWRTGSAPEKLAESHDTDRFPYDLARDTDGNIYVSFVVLKSANGDSGDDVIVRYPAQGDSSVWWTAPDNTSITGIEYDPIQDRLIAVDTKNSNLYGIPRANPADSTMFYEQTVDPKPGFDDVTVSPDGTLYLAALELNRVAALSPANELTYLAGAFRGSSRTAYDAVRRRLYVNNWNQQSLLSDQVLFVQIDVKPKLPFALDVIEWK